MSRRSVRLYPSLPAEPGERLSRQAAPWQVTAFEFQMVLRGFQDTFELAAQRLVAKGVE